LSPSRPQGGKIGFPAMSALREEALWRVVRLDDNGNRFEVAGNLSQRAAERLIDAYERKGHKQTYCKEL
jgi:hypothetical protein